MLFVDFYAEMSEMSVHLKHISVF